MSDLALDPLTNDLLLESGAARLAVGAEAVQQGWATRLTLFRGECFLDPSLGIDFQNEVLIKGARQQVLRGIFGSATRSTPGVADIAALRITLDRATRELSVKAAVTLDDGSSTTLSLAEPLLGE